MPDPRIALALAGGDASPLGGLFLPILMFGIFYFIWFQPMRTKQKKLETTIKALKPGDKVILNPGIFGTIVRVDEETFQVSIDDKTRIKVLKSAVAGLQGQPPETEKQ
jgi:preprotein translocase subunit YajC